MSSRVVSAEPVRPDGFRWLQLKRIEWEDPHGRQRLWESADRTTRRGEVDGVAILAKILRKGQPPLIPVLKQFRPPVAAYCLELPAGLVDAGETAAAAAVRELKEETGYTGSVCEVTPVCVSDPGMSGANMRYVTLEVDGDAPENQGVKQELEDGEFIQVELAPWGSLLHYLLAEMEATGCTVDARLLSYAWGLEHAKEAACLVVAAAAAEATAAAVARQQQQQQQQGSAAAAAVLPPPSAASGVSQLLDGQRRGGSDGSALESSASTGAPFCSPVMSAMHAAAGANGVGDVGVQPPSMALDGAAAAGAPAGGSHNKAPAVPGSSGGGASSWSVPRAWLLFASGVAAGAAGCSLLLLGSRSLAAR